jgi:hypothetical protein
VSSFAPHADDGMSFPIRLPLLLLTVVGAVAVGVLSAIGPLAGAFGVVALGYAVLILLWPQAGGLTLAVSVPILASVRRGFPLPGLRLSEALIVGTCVVVLSFGWRSGRGGWKLFDWAALAYVIASIVIEFIGSHLHNVALNSSALGTMFGPLQFFLLYRAVKVCAWKPSTYRAILRVTLMSSVPVTALAILQQFDVGSTRKLIISFTGSGAFQSYTYVAEPRATGPFPHWHSLGGYLLVLLLLGVALLLENDRAILRTRWLVVSILASAAGLLLTLVFVDYLAALGGVLFIAARRRKLRNTVLALLAIGTVDVIAFAPFMATRLSMQFSSGASSRNPLLPETIGYRFQVWTNEYLPELRGRWLIGYGANLPPDILWAHTESVYITLLLRGGLCLLVVWTVLNVSAYAMTSRRVRQGRGTDRAVALTFQTLVFFLIPMQLVYPYFTDTGLPHLFWILAALVQLDMQPPLWEALPTSPSTRELRSDSAAHRWTTVRPVRRTLISGPPGRTAA